MNAIESKYFQHEFEVYYQPILRLGEHRVCSFEVILNWQQERKLLYPSRGIALLDQAGLSEAFRNWILQQTCRQISAWHQAYSWVVALDLNVHLSPKQFLAQGLMEQLKALKAEYPLAVRGICIELEYDFIVTHFDVAAPLIRQLTELGFQLQVNDFYPSYTTLQALDFLSIRKVQLSNQFIDALSQDPQTIDIFISVVESLKQSDIQVVINGFKEPEHLALIHRLAAPNWSLLCDLPTSAKDAATLINADSKVVPVKLPDYLRAMYKLGRCIRPLLGDTIVERYWTSTRPDIQWLSLQTPSNLKEIEGMVSEDLDVNKIALLQFWVERFTHKCARILPGLMNIIAQEADITPTESRLMKLLYSEWLRGGQFLIVAGE